MCLCVLVPGKLKICHVRINMSKTMIVFLLFFGLLFVYVFLILFQTVKDVKKIEYFQNTPDKPKDTDSENGSEKSEGKKETLKHAMNKDTDDEGKDYETNDKEESKKSTDEPKQPAATKDSSKSFMRYRIPKEDEPINDDDQRQFWIGKLLYDMNPNNGMVVFMREVDELSKQFKTMPYKDIKTKVKVYAESQKLAKNDDMQELIEIAKQIKNKNTMQPNEPVEKFSEHQHHAGHKETVEKFVHKGNVRGVLDGPKNDITIEKFLNNSAYGQKAKMETFTDDTPRASTYISMYKMYDKWSSGDIETLM